MPEVQYVAPGEGLYVQTEASHVACFGQPLVRERTDQHQHQQHERRDGASRPAPNMSISVSRIITDLLSPDKPRLRWAASGSLPRRAPRLSFGLRFRTRLWRPLHQQQASTPQSLVDLNDSWLFGFSCAARGGGGGRKILHHNHVRSQNTDLVALPSNCRNSYTISLVRRPWH